VQVIKRFPANVYAQLNFTAVTNGVIEYLVEQVGEDHVMFGTDAPMRDPRPQAGWLVFTRLPERVKRKIFGENFEKILARTFGA
jgi:predicted TIM-barrel fold metal-dependent hydrolase